MRFLKSLVLVGALRIFLSRPVCGQNTADFQYPAGGEVYNILDTVIVQWTSNYASRVLFTWYLDSTNQGANQASELNSVPQSGNITYSFTSLEGGPILWPAMLWFDLIYDILVPGHTAGHNGQNFNVTSTSGVPTTWALGTSYVGPTSTGSARSVATGSSSDPVPASSSTDKSQLSTGGKIGIGIGVLVAVLVIPTLAYFIRKHRQTPPVESSLVSETRQMHDEMRTDQEPRHHYFSHELPVDSRHEIV